MIFNNLTQERLDNICTLINHKTLLQNRKYWIENDGTIFETELKYVKNLLKQKQIQINRDHDLVWNF